MNEINVELRFVSDAAEVRQAEKLQEVVWGAADVVPYHMLLASVHAGGVLIGAYIQDRMIGFVYGFPALDIEPDKTYLRHQSHMLAVLPEYRDGGVGFALKRAQWQWVRSQGIERVTWTYDPLQSRNAYLNISRLGGVCAIYLEDYYGEMTDPINAGSASDRFLVDWWLQSPRVKNRLETKPRRPLQLGDYFSAGAEIVNPTKLDSSGYPKPPEQTWSLEVIAASLGAEQPTPDNQPPFYLVEIPPDIQSMRQDVPELAQRWRMHTREVFKTLFARGYLVTDFIFSGGESPRSFYLLSDGERRLSAIRKNP